MEALSLRLRKIFTQSSMARKGPGLLQRAGPRHRWVSRCLHSQRALPSPRPLPSAFPKPPAPGPVVRATHALLPHAEPTPPPPARTHGPLRVTAASHCPGPFCGPARKPGPLCPGSCPQPRPPRPPDLSGASVPAARPGPPEPAVGGLQAPGQCSAAQTRVSGRSAPTVGRAQNTLSAGGLRPQPRARLPGHPALPAAARGQQRPFGRRND